MAALQIKNLTTNKIVYTAQDRNHCGEQVAGQYVSCLMLAGVMKFNEKLQWLNDTTFKIKHKGWTFQIIGE